MIAAVAAHGPSALWYATRGAGAAMLVLLTASVVLGVSEQAGWRPAGSSRFAVASLHRSVSLLAVGLLAVHVGTTLLDPFPRIGLTTALIPFASPYRPLWLGLGTVASDLLLALVLTSLVRRRLGYRAWRRLHWLAYACWPVALLHGLGTGSDIRSGWMLALTIACVLAVLGAIAGRITVRPGGDGARIVVLGIVSIATPAAAIWAAQGPLAAGWARRAGTPASVLAAFRPAAARAAVRPSVRPDPLARRFSASLSGRLNSGVTSGGVAVVDMRLALGDGPRGLLRLRIGGQPLPGGGVRMDRSAVTLGPPSQPARYAGRIDALRDNRLTALVGTRDGRVLRLRVTLSLGSSAVAGTLQAEPEGTGG